MLDRQAIRANPDAIRAGARRKGIDAPIDDFLETEKNWRAAATQLESVEAEANRVSKGIGAAMAQGRSEEAETAKRRAAELKAELPTLHDSARNLKERLEALELQIPNMPHSSVPDGKDSSENIEVSRYLDQPSFDFEPKAHWDIAYQHGLLDFERGTKIAGSGFIVFRAAGARLQRALINFMLDFHVRQHGYIEIYPPYLVNRESLIGTGQLPKFELEQYHMERDDLFLIATSEIPVTNLHRDEILAADVLPTKYVAFSGCFRREAGAAGRDTRGLLRVHQFDKVEMVKFTTPETSYDELETLRQDAEDILRALGLHYRVVSICAGDMSFSNAKQYDLEVWAPGVDQYLEVSSISNFEDFQGRRANIRYRAEAGAKPRFVHTLNASGVACPRLMAALLETYQRADGSVDIPEALRPFMGIDKIS
ncbi:MAG TPA: serine--tRNA ligase [Fimbriimonadales bacterium]|nr:serine--tRNA ligase [Fimbriimonadales bacterium]